MSEGLVQQNPSHFTRGRVGIVGLGLIGGSIAKALHSAGTETYVWNRSRDTLEFALIESATGELTDELIATCELIVLATYPTHCVEWLTQKAPLIDKRAIVIDCAGTKRLVCAKLWPIAAEYGFSFVGAHPMAGTQYSGFTYARKNLFHKAPLILCPDPAMEDLDRLEILDRLTTLLSPLGFGTYTVTTPDEHDRMIAYTSQLAHVVSNAYIKSPRAQSHKGFSAGSYRDLTRVARLNPAMWTELFLDDSDYLIEEIDGLVERLSSYADALKAHDASRLEWLLAEGDRAKREAEGR